MYPFKILTRCYAPDQLLGIGSYALHTRKEFAGT
jgi:hypothetical protein